MTRLLLLAAAVLLAPAAAAQLTVDAQMVVTPSGPQTTMQTPSGMTLASAPSSGMILNAADASLSGAIDCSGRGALTAEGVLAVYSSVCLVADASGDVYTVVVRQDPADPDASTWRVLDGTGRYAGATGGGTARRLARTADGRAVFHVTGTVADVAGTH